MWHGHHCISAAYNVEAATNLLIHLVGGMKAFAELQYCVCTCSLSMQHNGMPSICAALLEH